MNKQYVIGEYDPDEGQILKMNYIATKWMPITVIILPIIIIIIQVPLSGGKKCVSATNF